MPTTIAAESLGAEIYREHPVLLAHFRIAEFDSPDQPGSGELMRSLTLALIDQARAQAGRPFRINSGYRTPAHNRKVGGVGDSAHTGGWAVDIHAMTDAEKKAICKALFDVGFRRFGIGKTFVHVDNDPGKKTPAVWVYPGVKKTFDPLAL